MNKKQNWLELAEFLSVGSFFFGVIITAITKQMLFSLTPLMFVIFFNIITRQKYINHSQLDSIVTRLDELESSWVKLKIELEESLNNTKINSLINQVNSLSSNQEKVSNYLYSELYKFIQSVENLQIQINQVSQIQASINNIESRIQKIEINQSYYNHRQDNNYETNTQETNKKRGNNESDFNNRKDTNYKRKTKKTNDIDKFNQDMKKLKEGLETFCNGWGDWGK